MLVLGEVACVTGNAGALDGCGGLAQSCLQESERLTGASPQDPARNSSAAPHLLAEW